MIKRPFAASEAQAMDSAGSSNGSQWFGIMEPGRLFECKPQPFSGAPPARAETYAPTEVLFPPEPDSTA